MSSDVPIWHSSLSKVLLQLGCNRHVYQSSTYAVLCDVLFPIAAPLQCVRSCAMSPNLDHLHITYSSYYLQSFAIVFSLLLGALFSMFLSPYENEVRCVRPAYLEKKFQLIKIILNLRLYFYTFTYIHRIMRSLIFAKDL